MGKTSDVTAKKSYAAVVDSNSFVLVLPQVHRPSKQNDVISIQTDIATLKERLQK